MIVKISSITYIFYLISNISFILTPFHCIHNIDAKYTCDLNNSHQVENGNFISFKSDVIIS